MIKIVSLIGFAAVLVSLVACRPEWLHDNKFLEGFITFEILSLLAVILTVTLASVANIHLAINRIIAKHLAGNADQVEVAEQIKAEIKSNAWVIFYSFIVAVLILFVKGLNEADELIVAICNASMLWVLFLNLLCILDIYRVIYGIVDLESGLEGVGPTNDHDGPDYTSESPEITAPSGAKKGQQKSAKSKAGA